MAAALEQRPYDAYHEPGKTASAVLAVAMHVLLAVLLVFGISWQSRPPEAVTVELWTAPPAPPVPVPRVEPKPEPKVEAPPPPKVEPKPEPKVEQKPDIAIEQEKRRLEQERKDREAEAERQKKLAEQKKAEELKKAEEQKKLAEQKRLEEEKRAAEQKKAEEQKRLADDKRRLEQQNRQRMNDELNRELAGAKPAPGIPGARITGPANVAGATSGDTDAYRAKIAAKIKGNVILPMDLTGNPSAEFSVTQLPSGEVIDVRLVKTSGNRTLDEAWERAIRKSTPLPKPDQPEAFRRELTLRFRPND